MMRHGNKWVAAALVFAALAAGAACRLYNLEKDLTPKYADFLNKVRYIVTAGERKIFLELPDPEKDAWIEEFWKRRDPDPATEDNEFKTEYFNRIETANKLFASEGIPGWLTDRGRIHILFGPPTDRIMNSMSGDVYGRCGETWYYGNFPVVFIDSSCTGAYKLVTYDLTGLRDLNLMYMHELNMATAEAQTTFREEKKIFDYDAKLGAVIRTAERIEAKLTIKIPYSRIWFRSEGKTLRTTFEAGAEIRDAKKALVWETKTSAEVSLREEELEAMVGKDYVIEVPIVIEDTEKIALMGQGKDTLLVTLTNKTANEVLRKTFEFK